MKKQKRVVFMKHRVHCVSENKPLLFLK